LHQVTSGGASRPELAQAAGFEIIEVQRLKAGAVERVFARKPVTA
jgi:hypothetical protein